MTDPRPCSGEDGTRQRKIQLNTLQLRDSETAKFVATLVSQIEKTIGTKLLALLPNRADQQHAARFIEAYFWKELGRSERPTCDNFSPKFHAAFVDTETLQDIAALQSKLAAIQVPQPSSLNLIKANVAKLTAMLNLDNVEAKVLMWSFALHRADDDALCELVYCVQFDHHAHKVNQLSLLFDEPTEAVEQMLGSPCRMLALRFVEAKAWHQARRLTDLLSVTQETLWLMEREHRSRNGMLTYLLEPEFDADVVDQNDTTVADLYASLPQAVAEAYEMARRERSLNNVQLSSIIHWYTLMEIAPAQLQPLARKFMLEPLRECIKHCFAACGQANQPVTPFVLLKALYAAAE